jgi:hypothetical protein
LKAPTRATKKETKRNVKMTIGFNKGKNGCETPILGINMAASLPQEARGNAVEKDCR